MEKDGLVIVYTGKGKGKTTAALGIALRATGYKMKICMIQFIKGSWHYGEHPQQLPSVNHVYAYLKGYFPRTLRKVDQSFYRLNVS